MKIQHQDKIETLISPQTIADIRSTADGPLFERETALRHSLELQAGLIENLASEVAGISIELLHLQTQRATRELTESVADELITNNRRLFAEKQSLLISEQEAARGLEASLLAMSAEVKQRRLAITAAENKKLADYANSLFAAYEKQVADQMRELVILRSWQSGLPLLGEAAVDANTILRNALKHATPEDTSAMTLATIVAEERALRTKVLGVDHGHG